MDTPIDLYDRLEAAEVDLRSENRSPAIAPGELAGPLLDARQARAAAQTSRAAWVD